MSDYIEIRDRMRERLPVAVGIDSTTARCVLDIVAAELVAMRATNVPPGSLHTVDGFVPGLGTVRDCLDCGCLVSGGPTRCKRCACAVEWPPGGAELSEEAAAAGDTFPPYGPGPSCSETVSRGLFDEAVALLRRAMVHVAPSDQRDEIRAFLRDVDEFPCCCESCADERANADAETPERA